MLSQLRAQLGPSLRIQHATRERMRQRHRHRLLIVDGDTLTPAELAGRRRAIRRYANGGGWVLGLDVGRGHLNRTFDRITGLSMDKAGRKDRVFMFRHATVNGAPTALIMHSPARPPQGAGSLSTARQRIARAQHAIRMAGLIRTRLRHPKTGLAAPAQTSVTAGDDDDPPTEALHRTWSVNEQSPPSVAPPYAFFAEPGSNPQVGVSPPAPGQQTISWSITHQFDLYLDNSPTHPDGNYQVLFYTLDGNVAPKKPNEKFQYMDDQFHVGAYWVNLERAWWTGTVEASVTPVSDSDDKIAWQASEPSTPNESTEYSSGQSFEIGISATEEGPAVAASYTVKNDKTYEVPDWAVTGKTAGNDLSWELSARNACDIRPDTFSPEGCRESSQFTPVRPNNLSLGNLSFGATARWRTNELLEPGGQGKLTFTLDTPLTFADTVCPYWFVTTCDTRFNPAQVARFTTGPSGTPFSLDASDVVPVGVSCGTPSACVEFKTKDPDFADGGSNETVPATVTLERPAPMDTTLRIFSDDANARLARPVDKDNSETTVTIPLGQKTGTFQIFTNANNLPKGATETADITVFYAEPYESQLDVKNK